MCVCVCITFVPNQWPAAREHTSSADEIIRTNVDIIQNGIFGPLTACIRYPDGCAGWVCVRMLAEMEMVRKRTVIEIPVCPAVPRHLEMQIKSSGYLSLDESSLFVTPFCKDILCSQNKKGRKSLLAHSSSISVKANRWSVQSTVNTHLRNKKT